MSVSGYKSILIRVWEPGTFTLLFVFPGGGGGVTQYISMDVP